MVSPNLPTRPAPVVFVRPESSAAAGVCAPHIGGIAA